MIQSTIDPTTGELEMFTANWSIATKLTKVFLTIGEWKQSPDKRKKRRTAYFILPLRRQPFKTTGLIDLRLSNSQHKMTSIGVSAQVIQPKAQKLLSTDKV